MAKIKLAVAPTFKAKVPIHIAGAAEPEKVEFVFKGMGRKDFKTWLDALREQDKLPEDERRDQVDIVKDIAIGWELDDEFNDESLKRMQDAYIGSLASVVSTFIGEISGARLGN